MHHHFQASARSGHVDMVLFYIIKKGNIRDWMRCASTRGTFRVTQIISQRPGPEALGHEDEESRRALDHAVMNDQEEMLAFLLPKCWRGR